jgi:hypothetical protein
MISKISGPNLRGSANVNEGAKDSPGPTQRSPLGARLAISVGFSSHMPASGSTSRVYVLFLPKDAVGDDDIQLKSAEKNDLFVARVDDLIPVASGILQIRITLFVERVVGEMLAELKSLAEKALRGRP